MVPHSGARKRTRRTGRASGSCPLLFPQRQGGAFTLVEILAAIAIMGCLAAILFPALATARQKAHQGDCVSNLRQIGMALALYSQDNDGHYPPPVPRTDIATLGSWLTELSAYLGGRNPRPDGDRMYSPLFCKTAFRSGYFAGREGGDADASGYAINHHLSRSIQVRGGVVYEGKGDVEVSDAAGFIMVAEARCGIISVQRPDINRHDMLVFDESHEEEILSQPLGALRHAKGSNYLCADGHVTWRTPGGVHYRLLGPNTRELPSFEP